MSRSTASIAGASVSRHDEPVLRARRRPRSASGCAASGSSIRALRVGATAGWQHVSFMDARRSFRAGRRRRRPGYAASIPTCRATRYSRARRGSISASSRAAPVKPDRVSMGADISGCSARTCSSCARCATRRSPAAAVPAAAARRHGERARIQGGHGGRRHAGRRLGRAHRPADVAAQRRQVRRQRVRRSRHGLRRWGTARATRR